MREVKRFRADHRHVVETEFDDAQFVSVSDYDALQQRLTVAEQRESEAREELLDLSRKLDVFYSRSHGIKNLSAIEDANDKSKALQQRLTVAEQRVDLLEGLLKSGSSPTYAHCSAVMESLNPATGRGGCGSGKPVPPSKPVAPPIRRVVNELVINKAEIEAHTTRSWRP